VFAKAKEIIVKISDQASTILAKVADISPDLYEKILGFVRKGTDTLKSAVFKVTKNQDLADKVGNYADKLAEEVGRKMGETEEE
jgi:hypothetical protein